MPLYQVVDDGLQALGKLVSDPVRLADVLYCLVKDEADARQVSDEDFGRALAGDAITAAAEAFVEELIDFFPDARVRAGLRQVAHGRSGVRSVFWCQVCVRRGITGSGKQSNGLAGSSVSAQRHQRRDSSKSSGTLAVQLPQPNSPTEHRTFDQAKSRSKGERRRRDLPNTRYPI